MGEPVKPDTERPITLREDLTTGALSLVSEMRGRGANLLEAVRKRGRNAMLTTVDMIDGFANQEDGPRTTLAGIGRQNIAKGARRAIEKAKMLRLIDQINIQKLPRLLDDDEEDFQFKADIVDILDSRMGTISPFSDFIAFVSNRSFDKKISQERLTRFFESERILKLLLQKNFEGGSYKSRSPNFTAVIGSVIGATAKTLRPGESKIGKRKIDEETGADLDKKLRKFKEKYNPESKYTFSVFVERLKERYPEYDLTQWLEEQMPFFVEILRGYKVVENDKGEKIKHATGTQHVRNMVHGAYAEKTRNHNLHAEFISAHLGYFFHLLGPQPVISQSAKAGHCPCFMIDTEALVRFFRKLKDVKTREAGEGYMIDLITKICYEETQKHGSTKEGVTLFIHRGPTAEIITLTDPEEIHAKITETVEQAVKVTSPHINNQNLLVNPEGVPERINREYDKIFDKAGKLKQAEYAKMLKSIFEHREENEKRGERIDSIRNRISEIFEEVNGVLGDVFDQTGVKTPQEIADILEINDYAELIGIAKTEPDKKKRYSARLKMELTWLVYRCSYIPRFVFRESDSRKVKAKMEATADDIEVNNDSEIRTVNFLDHEDGRTELMEEGDPRAGEDKDGKMKIGEVRLIPAKVAGQDCYLLHNGNERTPRDYINLKSLGSLVINRIREKNMILEEVTDMIRMTFVVETMEELKNLKENIEVSLGGGRLIKWEDTYTEENGIAHVNPNGSKSKKYRTLRAVLYVPIFDGDKPYIVQFEMMVKLLEDAIKEKSMYNEIGHNAYKKKRNAECVSILAPRDIFPELYEEEKDPDDLSGEVIIRVKQVLSTASSESQVPKTLPKPSLPVSL